MKARVHGAGSQGVFLRDTPDGKTIDSLYDGDVVEITGPPVQAGGTWWIPVRTASGKAGWMAMDYSATMTPTSTKAP